MTVRVVLDDYTLEYQDDDQTKQAIFDKLLAFYKKHSAYSGESIFQSDGPQLEANDLLLDIAEELFKFKLDEEA